MKSPNAFAGALLAATSIFSAPALAQESGFALELNSLKPAEAAA